MDEIKTKGIRIADDIDNVVSVRLPDILGEVSNFSPQPQPSLTYD